MAPRDCRLNQKLAAKLAEPVHEPRMKLLGVLPAVFARFTALSVADPTIPATYPGVPVTLTVVPDITSVMEFSNGMYTVGAPIPAAVKVGVADVPFAVT